MEIKYTLEILTKDIQDIGKLVENLHNSPEGSTLELDLALSKLRNVYDVLNEIRSDISSQRHPYIQQSAAAQPPPPPVEPEPEAVVAPPEPEPVPEPEPEPEPEALVAPPESETVPEPPAKTQKTDTGTISERFAAESSINENMAGSREQDKESKLLGPPIENIGRNIGINDRFLIIRELFDGDSDGFGQLIRDLDNAGGIEDASEQLNAHFRETPDHEGVAILSSLVKRRFSTTT